MLSNNLEDRYNNGDIPLRYYCQLNGKSAVENYKLHQQKMQEQVLNKQLEDQIRNKVSKILEEELKGLLNLL